MPNRAEKLQTNWLCVSPCGVWCTAVHEHAHISSVGMWVLVFVVKCFLCLGCLLVKRPLDLSGNAEEDLSTAPSPPQPTLCHHRYHHNVILYVVFADWRQSAVKHESDHYTHVLHAVDDEEICEPILPWKLPRGQEAACRETGHSRALPGSPDITT